MAGIRVPKNRQLENEGYRVGHKERTSRHGFQGRDVTYVRDKTSGWERVGRYTAGALGTILTLGTANASKTFRKETWKASSEKSTIILSDEPCETPKHLGYNPYNRNTVRTFVRQLKAQEPGDRSHEILQAKKSADQYILEKGIKEFSSFIYLPNGDPSKAVSIRVSKAKNGKKVSVHELRIAAESYCALGGNEKVVQLWTDEVLPRFTEGREEDNDYINQLKAARAPFFTIDFKTGKLFFFSKNAKSLLNRSGSSMAVKIPKDIREDIEKLCKYEDDKKFSDSDKVKGPVKSSNEDPMGEIRIPKDGNCLFAAALNRMSGEEKARFKDPDQLRKAAVQWCKERTYTREQDNRLMNTLRADIDELLRLARKQPHFNGEEERVDKALAQAYFQDLKTNRMHNEIFITELFKGASNQNLRTYGSSSMLYAISQLIKRPVQVHRKDVAGEIYKSPELFGEKFNRDPINVIYHDNHYNAYNPAK